MLSPAAYSRPRTCSRSPSSVALSDRKRTCGWFSTSKKSAARRCLSRNRLFVSRLAASIVSWTAGVRESAEFRADPVGKFVDPDRVASAYAEGATFAELHARATAGELGPETAAVELPPAEA